MRTTMFGDTVIDSTKDDLGLVEDLQEAGDEIYAVIRESEDTPGMYDFEVLQNEDGEMVVSSDPIFDSRDAVRRYLSGWVSDIQSA